MANSRSHTLSSDPNFLLSLISEIGDESESEDEFDGWLGPDDGPVAFRKEDGGDNTYSPSLPLRCSDSLDAGTRPITENALQLSPSHVSAQDSASPSSPMQTSPSLSPVHSPLQHSTPQLSPNRPISHQQHSSTTTSSMISPPSFTASPGVIPDMEGKSPVEFFRLMFDDRVTDLIYSETSRYANQYLERERQHLDTHPHARAHDWQRNPLTLKEVDAFLALLIAMGLCGLPTLR